MEGEPCPLPLLSVDELVTEKEFFDVRNEALLPYGPDPNAKENLRDNILKEFLKFYVGDVTDITNQIPARKRALLHRGIDGQGVRLERKGSAMIDE